MSDHPPIDVTDLSASSPEVPFGANLAPVLFSACDDRLSDLHWFRTDWQRGGALTGYAVYRDDDGQDRDVVVKLPIPPGERAWLVHLNNYDDVAPHVFAEGAELGGYDMAWVVMERLAHGPLGASWGGAEFDLLAEAAGRFYAAAQESRIKRVPKNRDWDRTFHLSREAVHDHGLPEAQRWNKALKKAHRRMKEWLKVWEDRPTDGWCHGDLHFANAMTRNAPPDGPAVLFDYALTRPGCWIDDALYIEHLWWAHRERLNGRKLCKQIGHERKKMGLPLEKDWAKYAEVGRTLFAMAAPMVLEHHGTPQHLHAALEMLEAAV